MVQWCHPTPGVATVPVLAIRLTHTPTIGWVGAGDQMPNYPSRSAGNELS